jgi:hypothetical protein
VPFSLTAKDGGNAGFAGAKTGLLRAILGRISFTEFKNPRNGPIQHPCCQALARHPCRGHAGFLSFCSAAPEALKYINSCYLNNIVLIRKKVGVVY